MIYTVDVKNLNKWKLHRLLSSVKSGTFLPDEFDEKYKAPVLNIGSGNLTGFKTLVSFGDGISFECSKFQVNLPERRTVEVRLHGRHPIQFAGRDSFQRHELTLAFPLINNGGVHQFFQNWWDEITAVNRLPQHRQYTKEILIQLGPTEMKLHGAFPISMDINYPERPMYIERDDGPRPIEGSLEVKMSFDYYVPPPDLRDNG